MCSSDLVPETVEELRTALQAFKDNDMAHKMYGADAGSTRQSTIRRLQMLK